MVSQPQFPSFIFLKCLRMAQEHLQDEYSQIKDLELSLCVRIWEKQRDNCLDIGNELIRLITCLHEVPKLRPINDGLMEYINGQPLFKWLEEMRSSQTRNEYVASLIPLSVERKLDFMVMQVPHDASLYYVKWLQDALMIEARRDSESIYIDIVRHITLNMRSELGSRCVQRHTLLKGILSSVSHQVIQPLVWQALYLDWLYFDPKLLPLYEPGYQLLFQAVDQ